MTTSSTPNPLDASALPWEPLLTITRSGQPELTLYGILYAWAEDSSLRNNAGRSLIRCGNVQAPLWTRSLLKPWQLLTVYPTLKHAYPDLQESHYALMAASHQGEAQHQRLFQEMLQITGLPESALQCPACLPLALQLPLHSQEVRVTQDCPDPVPTVDSQKSSSIATSSRTTRAFESSSGHTSSALSLSRNHPCSGKHVAHLLYRKAKGLSLENYLHPDEAPFPLLKALLCYLLNLETLPVTRDGCGMPNYGLNAIELAQLYHSLAMPLSRDMLRQAPDDLEDVIASWEPVSRIISQHPEIVGGHGRLDTRLMQHGPSRLQSSGRSLASALPLTRTVIAKEGADGLFALGLGPAVAGELQAENGGPIQDDIQEPFPQGLGVLIKLASGYQPQYLEQIANALFSHWGFEGRTNAESSDKAEAVPRATQSQSSALSGAIEPPLLQSHFHFLPSALAKP